ncbi:MAG: hypothetical protein C0501_30185 [Isosphaera sp.]|nr:hypothetical protein [Isosphaera sp.]
MTLTLLLIGGVAIAIAAAYMATSRAYDVVPSLAGDAPAARGAAGADTLSASATGTDEHRAFALPRADWQLATVADLTAAEDLLDCLENQGYEERELVVLGNACFAVRWR